MLVRFNSHRARQKAFERIPKRLGFYSLRRSTGKGVYEVTEAERAQLAGIKGVTRFRPGDDLMRCWSG